jgi:glycosyltransferase involved in cell wall biosynthesis
MRIALLESYYGGSHKAWADGYRGFSRHKVDLITLHAQFWKWRMQGGAISFARLLNTTPDLILVSSMIDLSIFRALTRNWLVDVPIAMYFHENQLSYPQSRRQNHGWRYGFINYVSALCADANFFNSQFHLDDFMAKLPRMLKHFADYNELETIDEIRQKSSVLPLGIDLRRFDDHRVQPAGNEPPIILWNHRWEHDKDPATFVQSMINLADEGCEFKLAIAGERFGEMPDSFRRAQSYLGDRIIQLGYVDSFADYARLLWRADYVVSTAWQEFFGLSVCEAIYCGCVPILPDRLNYPNLITEGLEPICLYQRDRLTAQLRYHLDGDLDLDMTPLRKKISRFDWRLMAPRYDDELEQLATRHRSCSGQRRLN